MNFEHYTTSMFIRVALVRGWDEDGQTYELSFYMSDWGKASIFTQPKIDKGDFMRMALRSKKITCKGNDIWYWFDEQYFLIKEKN